MQRLSPTSVLNLGLLFLLALTWLPAADPLTGDTSPAPVQPTADERSDPIAEYIFSDSQERTLAGYQGRMLAVWGMCKSCGEHTAENFALIKAAVERRNTENRPISFIILTTAESNESARAGLAEAGVAIDDDGAGVVIGITTRKGPLLRRESAVYGIDGAVIANMRLRDLGTIPAERLPSVP
jgi:hypothetical protein